MKCILKNIEGTLPDIEINDNDPICIEKKRQKCVQQTVAPKKHLLIIPDLKTESLSIQVLGHDTSALNGTTLKRNDEYLAEHGDIIEVIPKKYQYEIKFVNKKVSKRKVLLRKRKSVTRETQMPFTKKIRWEIEIKPDNKQPFPGDFRWESFNNRDVLVFTTPDCVGMSKIAAYDMDRTLIKPQCGRLHPINRDDWEIAYGTTLNVLKSKVNDGYKIVVFTNQAALSYKKYPLNFKMKIENITKAINLPMQFFIATNHGYFRKPIPGMWQLLGDLKNDNVPIDLKKSFYVGDAAGRSENRFLSRRRDHSSVDRLLAFNLNIQFYTPEEHFLNTSREKWIPPTFNPTNVSESMLLEPATSKLISRKLEVILMVGIPGSGKSYFCKNSLESRGYEIISRDAIGTWQKCVTCLSDCLKIGRKAVIDNINGNKKIRQRYINMARKFNVECRCFLMTTSSKHAQHNIAFRDLINVNNSHVNQIAFNAYKSNFEEPTLEEGFSEIVRVNFVPHFRSEAEKELYNIYLLPA